jgi:hypothetical protein
MLLSTAANAATQVNIFIGEPRASIGINLPAYPDFVRVPGYPVYYAPHVHSNVFFYDGLYWVYTGDRWYASTWYNGPWGEVGPEAVPVYLLRVPVRYYRAPPTYFSGWAVDAPPRWDTHWGGTWAQRRSGWDQWNRSSVPAAAPLPVYQRQYTGTRYPSVEQQLVLQSEKYTYQPRDAAVKQYYSTVVRTAPRNSQSANSQSASSHAPGQVKKQQGAQSAKEFAPGQVKKQQQAQSAREYAPGQVEKPHGNRDHEDANHGQGHGKGKDKDKENKGKGHGKD